MTQQERAEQLQHIQAQAHQETGRVWYAEDVNALTREVTKAQHGVADGRSDADEDAAALFAADDLVGGG